MTNRARFLQTNEYDLLIRMQYNLFDAALTKKYICVLEGIDGRERECDPDGCEQCIQKWLNEEAAK